MKTVFSKELFRLILQINKKKQENIIGGHMRRLGCNNKSYCHRIFVSGENKIIKIVLYF